MTAEREVLVGLRRHGSHTCLLQQLSGVPSQSARVTNAGSRESISGQN
jgi:hypothetical protein